MERNSNKPNFVEQFSTRMGSYKEIERLYVMDFQVKEHNHVYLL